MKPHSESEVSALVGNTSKSIRIVGNRFSYGQLLSVSAGDGIILDLSEMHGLLRVTDDTATFAAGTCLQEVFDILSNMERMLPCSPGVISLQTLAGAIGTGTHGQGLKQSSIADVITSLRVVGADGEVWNCDRNHPWFGALQLNLGCLGIITEVTLRTVPSTLFTCLKFAVDTQVLCENYVNWNRQFSFCKAWWFPENDQAHVWLVRPATADEARLVNVRKGHLVSLSDPDGSLKETVTRTMVCMQHDTGRDDLEHDQFKTVRRFTDFSDVSGDIYQILCKGIPVPQVNLEVAVPLQSFDQVQQTILDWYKTVRPKLHYPVILRSTGPSTAWLSPAYGRESCYYGFVAYLSEDRTIPNRMLRYLEEVQCVLTRRGGCPHWGKYFNDNLYNWSGMYDKWNEFARVRKELDAHGRFANEFISRLFRM